jgi:hypothetical protein
MTFALHDHYRVRRLGELLDVAAVSSGAVQVQFQGLETGHGWGSAQIHS